MSLNENFTLPGVITEVISDYSQDYDSSLFGKTDSVLIMGTAFNGPVGMPVEVYSPEHGQYIFGGSYDSKSRKEATLVSNIKDAWDRGCRTIYALRVSGKAISKDYQLAVDTSLKLRVAGLFPSNANKDLSLLLKKEAGRISVEIYKPAKMATIAEKNQGLVDKQDAMLLNRIEISEGGVELADELTDLIARVNTYPYNNSMRLSLVDENGNDVTYSPEKVAHLKAGDMFPGIYTVGRDANAAGLPVDSVVKISVDQEVKPYVGFEGSFFKIIDVNTDVASDLPIFSNAGDLHDILGVGSVKEYDFLKVTGKIDELFLKDKVDYEEVDLSDFELYKRLGSGFAINAQVEMVESKGKQIAKVKEVENLETKKTAIPDGIYSMLENSRAMYRVLSEISADSTIKSRLPRPAEFKIAAPEKVKVLGNAAEIESKVDSKDLSLAKGYEFSFVAVDQDGEDAFLDEVELIKNELKTEKIIREATLISLPEFEKFTKKVYKETHEDGTLLLVSGNAIPGRESDMLLYVCKSGKYKCLHNLDGKGDKLVGTYVVAEGQLYKAEQTPVDGNVVNTRFTPAIELPHQAGGEVEYSVVALSNGTFVVNKFELKTETPVESEIPVDSEVKSKFKKRTGAVQTTLHILAICTVEQLFLDSENVIFTGLKSAYFDGQGVVNKIEIKSVGFDFSTIDEVAEILKADKDFAKLFLVNVLDLSKAQEYVSDVLVADEVFLMEKDRKITYDTALLIPYRTDDNFARQLAQHCMYTSMKTSATHGIIGVAKLLDTSLGSVANRVQTLVNLQLDSKLVVKKGNGTDMLDKDNMPYQIGRKISIPVAQYKVVNSDNYTYISNFAAGYAGMISKLPLDQSSTCQSVAIPVPSYEFTNYQLTALTAAGFVTTRNSYTKGFVVTDGITMADGGDALKRLSASRIADAIDVLIRNACEPFIGAQNHLANQNSLNTAINSALSSVRDKLIEGYDFKLVVDKQSAKLGIINVAYKIIPIYEIKQINNKITISE